MFNSPWTVWHKIAFTLVIACVVVLVGQYIAVHIVEAAHAQATSVTTNLNQ